jgi:hypothetical protein
MEAKRVSATGPWSFVVGAEFELIDNGDSVQAVAGDRVVYVSSKSVAQDGAPVGAPEIRSFVAKSFGVGAVLSHEGANEQGDAQLRSEEDSLRLFGTMCSRGTVATCVIDFPDHEDEEWAISVWRSLTCSAAG